MASTGESVRVYRELAEIYGRQGQAQMRDRFLVLAADAALTAGHPEEAEQIRGLLLKQNPDHLLKPYASFAEALKSNDVRNYVTALRRSHPYERAEHLLESLGKDAGQRPLERTQTQPVPRITPESREPKAPPEDLKVFRVQEPEEAPRPVPPPSPPTRAKPQPTASTSPARPSPKEEPVRPAATTRPTTAPDIFPLRREPNVPVTEPSAPRSAEESEHGSSVWVSTGLFVLLLLLALALGGYTLARPFLPAGWLP
jgi:hypothetical protein